MRGHEGLASKETKMSFLRPRVAAVAACLVLISVLSAACTEPQGARPTKSGQRLERLDNDRR
jgi:hypothetical protein